MIYKAIEKNLDLAVKCILNGEIIIYSTDTVYGFGVDATNKKAINKLNKLKGRIAPLSIIVSSEQMINKYIDTNYLFSKKVNNCLPVPFTFLLENFNNILPVEIGLKTGKIGIRIPNTPFVIKLVEKLKRPIVTTSVNIHNEDSLNDISSISKQFGEINIFSDYINNNSVGSTIVDITCFPYKIIRKGDGQF